MKIWCRCGVPDDLSPGLSTDVENYNPVVRIHGSFYLTTLRFGMPESKRRKPKNPPQSQAAIAARKSDEPSPTWYVAVMTGLMVLGVILVLIRFIFDQPQFLLLIGLGCIAGGFLMTTNYR